MCGTDPWPVKYKAKKYKLHDHFLTKESLLDYSVSPIPFPLDFGFRIWIWDLDLGLDFGLTFNRQMTSAY